MGFRDRITDLASNTRAALSSDAKPRSRDESDSTVSRGIWFGESEVSRETLSKEDIKVYRDTYELHPLVREAITTYVAEVMEPGYRIEAGSEADVTKLEEWAEECGIVGGLYGQDLLLVLKQALTDRMVAGSAPIEHVGSEEEPDHIIALKPLLAETLKAYKIPGQNLLVRPDDEFEGDEDYPRTDDGDLAAFVQYDDDLSLWDDEDEVPFTLGEITLLTREVRTGNVFGVSVIAPIQKRAESMLKKQDDVDQAIETMAYPHRYIRFGDEEAPWDYQTEIKPYMEEYEPGNMEPGQTSGGPFDVQIEQYQGEFPEGVHNSVSTDVDTIMAAMPVPKYELGAFEADINQFVSRSQENKHNLEIREARRELEAEITPILQQRAEELDIANPDEVKLIIEPEEPEPLLSDQIEAEDGQAEPVEGDPAADEVDDDVDSNEEDTTSPGEDLPAPPDDEPARSPTNAAAAGVGGDSESESVDGVFEPPTPGGIWAVSDATATAANDWSDVTGSASDGDTDAETTDLADPRLISTDAEFRELRTELKRFLIEARDAMIEAVEDNATGTPMDPNIDTDGRRRPAASSDSSTSSDPNATEAAADGGVSIPSGDAHEGGYPSAGQTDLAADSRAQKQQDNIMRAVRTAYQGVVGVRGVTPEINEAIRPILRRVVRKTITALQSSSGGRGPALDVGFDASDDDAIDYYTETVGNQVTDATEEMYETIRGHVRRGLATGQHYDDISTAVRNDFSESKIGARSALIARMETQHATQGSHYRKFRASKHVVGMKAINPCSPSTTDLCEHLAGCGPRTGATVWFDDEKSISQQWMDQTSKTSLVGAFVPLPPIPPFHFNCRTGIIPVTSRPDDD